MGLLQIKSVHGVNYALKWSMLPVNDFSSSWNTFYTFTDDQLLAFMLNKW